MKPSAILCLVLALAIGSVAAPLNDSFIYSATLAGNEHFVVADNTGATAEAGEPNHAGQSAGNSLWWSWTAPASGHVSVDTAGSFFHPVLAVYTGNAVNSLTLVASNFFEGAFDHPDRSKLSFTATAGQRYRIAVDTAVGADGPGVLILYLRAGAVTENDAFANAWVIPAGTLSASGSNVNATREAGEPDHGAGTEGRSIWWRWTAQANGPVMLDAAGSPSNTVIAVYTGSALNGLTLIAYGAPVFDSALTFQAVAGTTYRIALDHDRDTGPIVLNFRQRPANDSFANAVVLTGADVTALDENRGATKEAGEPNHAGISGTKSVWWRWTAPSTGLYTLDAIGSSLGGGLFNPVLAVYTGSSVAALSAVASENGVDGTTSRLRFAATQGTTYHIAVDGNQANHGGDIMLRLAPSQPSAPNDYFANAIPIAQLPATFSGSNLGATTEGNEVPDDVRSTVWWRFVAQIDGVATLSKVHGVPNIRMVAYQGTSITSLGVAGDSLDSVPFPPRYGCSLRFPVRAGIGYAISIGSGDFNDAVSDQGDFTMNLSVTPGPPNNDFANRIVIPSAGASVIGSNVGANSEVGEPHADELGALGYDSVWWSYTPTVSGAVIVTTAGSSIDTFLGVYTGSSVNALTQIATNDTAYFWNVVMGPFFDRISRVKFNGVAGQPYRIAVTTARGAPGEVVVNLPTVAMEEIVSTTSILQPDRSLSFTNYLRLTNLRTSPTGPLRFRPIARAGYSHVDGLLDDCGKNLPSMNLADQEIGIVDFPSPGYLAAQTSITSPVSGVCPPPYEAGKWGNGWGAIAVLEELTDAGWEVRDSRLLVFGNWPRVSGFIGPGGGVITVASGTGQVLPSPGFIDVSIGPPAAVRLGAQWRVSPTNYGSLSLFTNFTSQSLILAVRSNDFSIDVRDLAGFNPPTNRAVTVRAGLHTPLNLLYSVHPPRLFYDRNAGLSITGTPGTAYRIERADGLRPPILWSSNAGRTLSAGQNPISNTTPAPGTNRFYRAFWLSD